MFKRRFVPIWGLRGDQHLVRKYTCKYIFRYRVWPTNHSCRHAYAKHVYHQKIYQTYRVLISYIHTRTCGFERKIEIYTCSVCYASTGKTRKEPQGQGPRGQHTVTDCHEGQPSLGVGGSTRMSREDMSCICDSGTVIAVSLYYHMCIATAQAPNRDKTPKVNFAVS